MIIVCKFDATYVDYKDKTKQEAYSTKLTGKINDNWESSLKIGKGTDLYSAQQKYNIAFANDAGRLINLKLHNINLHGKII